MKPSKHILPIIVFAQFCGTSLWFSGNAVLPSLIIDYNLTTNVAAHLTTAVQIGFIVGTLVFAIFSLADKFSPSRVFFTCTIIGAFFNLMMIWDENTLELLVLFRFMTGVFLAGIYPVGMKIASDYYDKGLGRSLGYLVGALVLGTAFPHLLRDIMSGFPWRDVVIATSILAVTGGVILILCIPDGPFRRAGKPSGLMQLRDIFKNKSFTRATLGYVGHMWELYTFWTLVPLILITYNTKFLDTHLSVSLYSFIIIGIGSIGCIWGGVLSEKIGVQKVARSSLLISAICCLLSPGLFFIPSSGVILAFLCIWGMAVIADSPLFSTLVAQRSTPQVRGTALTIVNSIGFATTIVSIQLLLWLQNYLPIYFILPLLAIGPIFGLIASKD